MTFMEFKKNKKDKKKDKKDNLCQEKSLVHEKLKFKNTNIKLVLILSNLPYFY